MNFIHLRTCFTITRFSTLFSHFHAWICGIFIQSKPIFTKHKNLIKVIKRPHLDFFTFFQFIGPFPLESFIFSLILAQTNMGCIIPLPLSQQPGRADSFVDIYQPRNNTFCDLQVKNNQKTEEKKMIATKGHGDHHCHHDQGRQEIHQPHRE